MQDQVNASPRREIERSALAGWVERSDIRVTRLVLKPEKS
jgi:hypothetical protein